MCLVSTLNAGFRMKEILLDLAEVTAGERPEIDEQLVDFGVVGPGPRRALNFVNNRRWFDNEYDRSPQVFLWGGCHANGRAGHSCAALPMRDFSQAEKLYVDELRAFRTYLQSHTSIAELKALNLLGVQFALCEASKARVLWFGTGRDVQKRQHPSTSSSCATSPAASTSRPRGTSRSRCSQSPLLTPRAWAPSGITGKANLMRKARLSRMTFTQTMHRRRKEEKGSYWLKS